MCLYFVQKSSVGVSHIRCISKKRSLCITLFWSSFAAGFVDGVKVKKVMIAKVRMHAEFM